MRKGDRGPGEILRRGCERTSVIRKRGRGPVHHRCRVCGACDEAGAVAVVCARDALSGREPWGNGAPVVEVGWLCNENKLVPWLCALGLCGSGSVQALTKIELMRRSVTECQIKCPKLT